MSRLFVSLAVLVLAACSGPGSSSPTDGASSVATQESRDRASESVARGDAAGSGLALTAVSDAPAPPAPPAPGQPNLPPANGSPAMIAYSYSMSLELPAAQVIAARDAHLQACLAAGPSQCQLLGSSSSSAGEQQVSAQLQLRGAPRWLETFRAGVAADAGRLDGRVTGNSISSEDLTRQMVDTEATMRAQFKLRDRLSELLAKHPGKLSDLLEVERELARVQGEIDARTSELNVMRTRIAMSDLSIGYQSRGVLLDDRTADPTLQALREFLQTVSYSFAGVVRFVAALLPWLLVLLPAAWLLRRAWRRRLR